MSISIDIFIYISTVYLNMCCCFKGKMENGSPGDIS